MPRKKKTSPQKWAEIGTPGLEIQAGFVSEAYHADLQWPTCQPLFSRIRRSDPEISIVRQLFVALASDIVIKYQTPEEVESPTPDDELAVTFGNEILKDLDGGIAGWIDTLMSYVPFMGWGYWEVVPGLRRSDWRPPDGDLWRSQYEDGRIGIRRLAWRDHSSFDKWEIDEYTGQLHGMWQRDYPNQPVLIPLERSVHLTFGDNVNPEGLSPLEAIWRLERIKYGLEVIQGIGYEHAAGHVKFRADQVLTAKDKANIKKAARALLSAQEGNYILLPGHIDGDLIDVDFAAASSIIEAIKYYGILKLQLYMMQWIALSATTGTGSFAAKKEDTSMFVLYFNSMITGFLDQLDRQIGPWIFDLNREAFPNMTMRPKLKPAPIEKMVDLGDLTQFVAMLMEKGFPMNDNDFIAIRRKSDFLPEALPIDEEGEEQPEPDSGGSVEGDEGEAEDEIDDAEMVTAGEVRGVIARFSSWAEKNAPRVFKVLQSRVKE